MSPRISEEKIEEIRKSVDIVDMISEYVQLKKQGRNFVGLCPFHGEKTPSFSVSPDKQLYHCFGCGAGGNVFSFLMELDGLSFIESVEKIANRTNVELPELESGQKDEDRYGEERKYWYKGHELAAKLYHHILSATDEGREAREYLRKRGFTKEVIDTFQIGYAPNSWDFLTTFLEKRQLPMNEIVKSGLLAVREFDQKPFDRFRDRIMFPIWDRQGNIIAFGGRILKDGNPKYLNSPESEVFNKSQTLYSFHIARPSMRKKNEAILFEGYVDVTSAWRAGIDNGVATLGTALTEAQGKMLRRNVDKVIICYDSDNAGQEATFKNAQLLEQLGLNIRVAQLPDGNDPDDYIRENGSERFVQNIIGQSLTFMGFKFRFYRKGKNLNDEGDRMEYIQQVLTEISKLPRAVERDHYLRQLAEEFSLSLDALKQEQVQIYKSHIRKEKHDQNNRPLEKKMTVRPQKKLLSAHENAERILLAYMLQKREIADQVQEKIGGTFNIDEHQAIAAHLYSFYAEGYDSNLSFFIERLNDKELKQLATELAMMTLNEELSEQELNDYIKQIENYPKKIQINELKLEQKKAEESGQVEEAAKIAMDIIQLEQQLKNSIRNDL
ncbi:DNA primase [Bacillus shivajii]|uniref:DNA primase n=1 Tax=Bacillus shivajii TaxID=1983719 RepID=UPI001CFAB08D|nr:DNA primase [Bacillus shivajii]UCZ54513.1 DNA primase [Bacillus shivajii]